MIFHKVTNLWQVLQQGRLTHSHTHAHKRNGSAFKCARMRNGCGSRRWWAGRGGKGTKGVRGLNHFFVFLLWAAPIRGRRHVAHKCRAFFQPTCRKFNAFGYVSWVCVCVCGGVLSHKESYSIKFKYLLYSTYCAVQFVMQIDCCLPKTKTEKSLQCKIHKFVALIALNWDGAHGAASHGCIHFLLEMGACQRTWSRHMNFMLLCFW